MVEGSRVILFIAATITATATALLLSGHSAWTSTSEWRGQSEINVVLAVNAHQQRRDVANTRAHTDVALADESSCVMVGLGKVKMEDLGLQTAFHDLGRCETKQGHAAEEGLTLEDTCLALLIKREQVTSSST